jgi:hypothetical protein
MSGVNGQCHVVAATQTSLVVAKRQLAGDNSFHQLCSLALFSFLLVVVQLLTRVSVWSQPSKINGA